MKIKFEKFDETKNAIYYNCYRNGEHLGIVIHEHGSEVFEVWTNCHGGYKSDIRSAFIHEFNLP